MHYRLFRMELEEEKMRHTGTFMGALLLAVCVALVASIVLVGCEGTAPPTTEKTAPVKEEKAETETEAEEAKEETRVETKEAKKETAVEMEETKPVSAMLTYIKNGKNTREVPYLPEGRKIATMETSKGVVKIELWEDKAPNTVVNFVSLANSGRYDGVDFHRVIDGFMAQTGDVEHKKGTGGPGYSIPAEFDASVTHVRGVVSMARSSDPDSAGSQFFIMFASASHLDGKYTAFGKVIEGMDIIDSLKKGEKQANGSVSDPDKIIKLTVESVS